MWLKKLSFVRESFSGRPIDIIPVDAALRDGAVATRGVRRLVMVRAFTIVKNGMFSRRGFRKINPGRYRERESWKTIYSEETRPVYLNSRARLAYFKGARMFAASCRRARLRRGVRYPIRKKIGVRGNEKNLI